MKERTTTITFTRHGWKNRGKKCHRDDNKETKKSTTKVMLDEETARPCMSPQGSKSRLMGRLDAMVFGSVLKAARNIPSRQNSRSCVQGLWGKDREVIRL